jgi:hypothetical protein
MKLTYDEYLERKADRLPLFMVRFLPYLDYYDEPPRERPRGYGYGSLEELYPTRDEAERRFESLRRSQLVENIELIEAVYPRTGGSGQRLIDEWNDRAPSG